MTDATAPAPIRVFVGCAPLGLDAESLAVLEHTIRRHASRPVEITWMAQGADPASPFHGWDTARWATPFSGFRWAVPELAGFTGRALYMDSDMIVQADLAELWDQPMARGKVVLAKADPAWRYCVSLWDCAAMRKLLPPIAEMKRDSMWHRRLCQDFAAHPERVQAFAGGDWNNLDGAGFKDLADPALRILHYTSMPHQPHLKHALPRLAKLGRRHWFKGPTAPHPRKDVQALFDRLLVEARAAGFAPEVYMPAEDVAQLAAWLEDAGA